MTEKELKNKIRRGETSRVQFKQQFTTQKEIAAEMVAFANCEGGDLLFGVKDKTGEILGLDYDAIQQTSRELGNTANEQVRPTIYILTDVVDVDGKMILVATVQRGHNKPYKDLAGHIWVKQGADKRRVTENSELLSLFQDSGEYHADEASVKDTSVRDIDTLALDRFFQNVYGKPMTEFDVPQDQLLHNLHITDSEGRLTTAGLLFFGQRPQQFKPMFVIKAVWFYGNSIAGTEYRDSRDIEGTIPEMFEQAMMWLKSCLRRTQNGQSFNSIGQLEIPETVLEELLQNALVHIDLLKTAAIRLMVFDDRVEIVNPGCVMGGHTIDEVKLGNSYARNPLMANFCAKTMPYRGLGSGIPRVLAEDSHVEFIDSKEGNQFTVRVNRPLAALEAGSSTEKAGINDKKAVSNDEKAVSSGKKAVSIDEKAVSNDEKAVSKKEKNEQKLLAFCKEPKTLSEICEHLGMTDRYKVKKRYIDPLLNKSLRMTEPESPKSPTQKYVAI